MAEPAQTDQALLRRAARRAGARPSFLALALLAYARAEGLDDPALARRLGCPPADLPALLLCRRPSQDSFRADVERIAERFGLDAAPLAEAIRLAEGVDALGKATRQARAGPLLAAARDRDQDDSPAGGAGGT